MAEETVKPTQTELSPSACREQASILVDEARRILSAVPEFQASAAVHYLRSTTSLNSSQYPAVNFVRGGIGWTVQFFAREKRKNGVEKILNIGRIASNADGTPSPTADKFDQVRLKYGEESGEIIHNTHTFETLKEDESENSQEAIERIKSLLEELA